MTELALIPSPDHPGVYTLDGAGELRTTADGWIKQSATLVAGGGRSWDIGRKGIRQRVVITDPAGGEPAHLAHGTLTRGGILQVDGDGAYELRPASKFKQRLKLSRDGRDLAILEGGWSASGIVDVDLQDGGASGIVDVDLQDGAGGSLVLLSACWLVKVYAEANAAAVRGQLISGG